MNGCHVIVNTLGSGIELPCYPDEITRSTSSNWSDQNIVGRSSPISAYSGTSYMSVSFSFLMHREMATNIEEVIRYLNATVYPLYNSSGLIPPITTFRFGTFKVKGIVRNINFTDKKPIIDNEYQVCEASVQIDCIPDDVVGGDDIYYNGYSLNPFN